MAPVLLFKDWRVGLRHYRDGKKGSEQYVWGRRGIGRGSFPSIRLNYYTPHH